MHTITVSRQGPHWLFTTDTVGSGQAETLTGLVTAVNQRVAAPLGQTPSVSWVWHDEFVREAMAVQEERARLKRLEDELNASTRTKVISLIDRGLSVRDISTLLGISAARVSQLKGSGFVHGDPEDSSQRAWVVDLFTPDGMVTKYVRGDLPNEIVYEGIHYRPTGGSHGANGGPMKHSYVPD